MTPHTDVYVEAIVDNWPLGRLTFRGYVVTIDDGFVAGDWHVTLLLPAVDWQGYPRRNRLRTVGWQDVLSLSVVEPDADFEAVA